MFQRLMPAGAALVLLAAAPALAHHPMQAMHLEPNALTGLISGLAHPLLGPGRADVCVAGLTIMVLAMEHAGASTLVVRDRGLRYALV